MTNYTIIGIDFGTSTTVVKVKNYYDGMKNNECQSLMISGSTVVPTLVFERKEDGKLFFGREAEAEFNSNCEGTMHRNFKMDLLKEDKKEKAQRLIREFIKYLYVQFSLQKAQLNVSANVKTFISYPAKWTPEIIAFMKQSVIDAGFGTEATVFGETEPTAAIYATFTNHADALKEHRLVSQNMPINVMMLDMGAGTSDVTVFRFMADRNNKFHIGVDGKIISHPAVDNAYLCGGREIDRMLAEYNLQYLRKISPGGMVFPAIVEKNESGVKEWKEENVSRSVEDGRAASISGELMTLINMMKTFSPGLQIAPYPDIDRGVFGDITREHWKQLRTLVVDALKKAGEVIPEIKGPEDIDLLIITGGHSQWYCVREMCLGHPFAGLPAINFKKIIENPNRLLAEARPQETVANGLVFRDLSFDISHTSTNNLWIQLSLNDKVHSEIYHVLHQFDTLPLTKTIEWKQKIEAGRFSLDNAKIRCRCCYGADESTGVFTSLNAYASLNGLMDFAIKTLLLPLVILGGRKEDYYVMVKLIVRIDEDGSAHINGNLMCNGNSSDFVMNL